MELKELDRRLRDFLGRHGSRKAAKLGPTMALVAEMCWALGFEPDIRLAKRSIQELGAPERKQHECSFCAKREDEVVRLIAGPGTLLICNECVELCGEILAQPAPTGEAT